MKRTIKWNKVVKESNDATLNDVESTYGKDVANALVIYCKDKKKKIDTVVNDLKEDGNGMTEWDWFEKWAKNKLHIDIYGGFSDDWMTDLDNDAERKQDTDDFDDNDLSDGISSRKLSKSRRKRLSKGIPVHDAPTRADMMSEGSGSRYGEQDIIDYIASSIYGCEWVADSSFDDYDPILEIETTDGDKFEISVKKI